MRWILEPTVFPSTYSSLVEAVEFLGHDLTVWDDDRWSCPPDFGGEVALFHGSLGNADRVRRELPWSPGAYCETSRFFCSTWYEAAAPWLVHRRWHAATVGSIVRNGVPFDPVFVRPDSPLKPFSGRVLAASNLSLAALDHGFYYDDEELPVIVAPCRNVGREWRFVVVHRRVVAGAAYAAHGRRALPTQPAEPVARFAASIAERLPRTCTCSMSPRSRANSL